MNSCFESVRDSQQDNHNGRGYNLHINRDEIAIERR